MKVKLKADVRIRGILIHSGSYVTVPPAVALDWRHRGWVAKPQGAPKPLKKAATEDKPEKPKDDD